MVSKDEKIKSKTMKHHLILKVITKFMVGVIVLFGLYVQFHGDYSPGGGFQAGVIIAASAKPNHIQYGNSENWRYFFMRVTGMIALVYMIYHILQFILTLSLHSF